MFLFLKKIIKSCAPQGLLSFLIKAKHMVYSKTSYAQEGEDLILSRIFENKKNGFFVDVGAHHPRRFSNTYLLYKHGWRGVNIDAEPGSMSLFNKLRRHDINLEIGIGTKVEKLQFYSFNEKALSTFSKDLAEHRSKIGYQYKIIDVNVSTLTQVLDQHLPMKKNIDLLTIDVEGFDCDVLKSLDWQKYKPSIILVEVLNTDYEKIENEEIYTLLHSKNYKLIAKTANTAFFQQSNNDKN